MTDEEFINVINDYYPFERYIVKTPKPINYLFNDLLLIELFVPNTKIEPILYDNNGTKDILTWTEVDKDEIYVKVKGVAGEARLAYYDFAEHIREEIRGIIIEDMGGFNWQSLYVEDEDTLDLEEMLNEQRTLIESKYGECSIKKDSTNARFIHV